jgi:hypothetical protein
MTRSTMRLLALTALMGGALTGACNNENFLGDETGGSAGKGSGGISASGGSGGAALCGGQVCGTGQECCGPAECGFCRPPGALSPCPATCGSGGSGAGGAPTSQGGTPSTGGSGGGTLCGGQICAADQVCCGPVSCGHCIPAMSGQACPATCGTGGQGAGGQGTGGMANATGGTSAGGGATCVAQQGSCAQGKTCCNGLTCCAGMPVQPGQEYCGSICPVSDRNLKTAIEPVNEDRVLERLMTLPVSTWSYKSEGTGVRHLGPMAQDFQATFGLGGSDRTILQVDGDGVALAAIQALARKFEGLAAENARLRQRVQQLEKTTAACGP